MFSFLHYVGTNYSNATDCWTGCVWTRNCRYVLSSSQAKSQHRKLTCTTLALGTEKYKNNIIYYPERLYPERLYSNSIISLDIIYYFAVSLNAIMHQFHNGIHLAGVHLVHYIAVRQRTVRHLNLCQHTVRLWPRITLLVNCASGQGLGTRLPPLIGSRLCSES